MSKSTADSATPLISAANPVTALDVRTYLQANTEFFAEHPDLLNDLTLPHPQTGNSVSLVERQMLQLQQRNRELNGQLNELVGIARSNHDSLQQLHNLQLALLACESAAELASMLSERLRSDFDCDYVQLVSFKVIDKKLADDAAENSPLRQIKSIKKLPDCFASFQEQPASVCGRIRPPQLQWLFPEQAAEINSAAMIPLSQDPCIGILAVGSNSESRFGPDQATLFLDQLGQLCAALLKRLKA